MAFSNRPGTKNFENAQILSACHYFTLQDIKSYFEDVFFSHSLYQKKFNLLIDRSCIAYHSTNSPTNFFNYRNTISSQYNIVKLFKTSLDSR